ncbi:MAG: S41 family peptidase [Oscillospiraceae bacterium]|nr:S41 family peptidase [Oscillospiraceae bacterium]MBR3534589.1 S41 family peptidase [Oscillospiraceae bacterium]MBR6834555.1 S41 family peptidase [Oscillospiraceae bacterium]
MNGNKLNKSVMIAVACTAMLTFSATYSVMKYSDLKKLKEFQLLAEAENIIAKHFYYDASDSEKLIDSAVGGYVSALEDPYSRYQSIKQTEERSESHSGLKTGVGITVLNREDGYMEVVEVNPKTPAEKAGMQSGDIIKKLDGSDVKEMGYEEAVNVIKTGEVDSVIRITVEREGNIIDFDVKREKIDIITATSEMIDNIGLIKISQFNDKTPEQVKSCFDDCVGKGAKGIIFDVRNNGGGLVTAVEKCLDPLLPEGKIAVAIYKDGKEETIVSSDAEETDMPMTVLMNGNSASGAELFAASLHDFKGAELVGETSFGKGIMQDTFSLSNGSTVVLTVAEYKTTKSECYHGIGLKPDYEVLPGDGGEDVQLSKALEVIKNKIV